MISAIDHINIVVSDLERSVKFYTELLGFKEINRVHMEGEWIEEIVGLKGVTADVVFIASPDEDPKVELLCYRSPAGDSIPANSLANTTGLRHIAFRVDDIQAAAKKLQDGGVKFLSEPLAVPASVMADNPIRKTLCYFHDPDGVLLEIAEYK